MTSPGGDLNVHVDRLHQHASQRRVQAADFITDKPPPVPNDPDDPTTGAAGDLAGDVHGVNHALYTKTHQRADKIDADGTAYTQQEQGAGGQVGALNAGGSGKGEVGAFKQLDAAAMTGALLQPLGQVVSGFAQGFNGLAGAALQGLSTVAGQGANVGGQMGAAMAKTMSVGSVGGAGGGGVLPGETASAGGGGEQTKPAAATSPLSSNGGDPTSPRRNGDYVIPENHDTHTVQSTGMGGGMPMAGMGAGGGAPSSVTKTRTYPVHVPGTNTDQPAEPIPVITEVAYAASPLTRKDDHDTDA